MSGNTTAPGSDLSIVIPCMGRKPDLMETLSALNPDGASVIVVDYSCPQHCGDAVEAAHEDATVVRVEGQTNFDPSHARNIGLEAVATDWVLFLDADIIPSASFVRDLFDRIDADYFYLFGRFRTDGAAGSMVAPTRTVRRLGGYDRRFVGYGGEDADMFERLLMHGLEPEFLRDEPGRVLAQRPSERVRHFEEKSLKRSLSCSRIYGAVKRDLMALEKRRLTDDELDTIRARAEEGVALALAAGRRTVEFSIEMENSVSRFFPHNPLAPPKVRRRLSYSIDVSD